MRLWLLVAVVLGCAFGALALPREARADNLVNWSYDESSKTLTIGGDAGGSATGTIDVDQRYASSGSIPWYRYQGSITHVTFATTDGKPVKPTHMAYWFDGCRALEGVDTTNLDVSSAVDMYRTFCSCGALKDLNVSGWDVSHVQNMNQLFCNCKQLTTLDVSKWDVSSVQDMYSLFSGCSSLGSLDVESWDVSSVETLQGTFRDCSSLESLDVSPWDVSHATTIEGCFSGCSSLASLDLTSWDVSHVVNMNNAFNGCSGLTSLDVSSWDVSSTKYMGHAFENCSNLTTIDLANWDTSSCSNISYMFDGCSSLDSLDIESWNVSSVVNMEAVFQNCTALKTLDLSGWNATIVERLRYAFEGCTNLEVLDLGSWRAGSKVNYPYGDEVFKGCKNLKTIINSSGWGLGSGHNVFSDCTSLKSFSSNRSFDANNVGGNMCNPSYGYFESGVKSDFSISKVVQDVPYGLPAREDVFKFDIEPIGEPVGGSKLYLSAAPISLRGELGTESLSSTVSVIAQDGVKSGDSAVFKVTEHRPSTPYFRNKYDAESAYYLKVTSGRNVTFGGEDLSSSDFEITAYEDEGCGQPLEGALQFTNAFECRFDPFTFQGEKLVLGRDGTTGVAPTKDTYQFLVVAEDGSPMPSEEELNKVGAKQVDERSFICKNSGRDILFPAIDCNGFGPYTYTISEKKTDEDNYSIGTYKVKVTANDKCDHIGEDGIPVYKDYSITYHDTVSDTDQGEAIFTACKVVSLAMHGKKESAGTGTATYRVFALEDNTPLPSGASGFEYTCSTRADGSIDYEPIVYKSPGRYTYGVQEVPNPDDLLNYDDTSYVVAVEVSLKWGNGVYEASVERVTYASDRLVPGENGDETYEVASEISNSFNKTDGTLFKTGTQVKLYQAAVESGVPRHDWTGGVINKSVQYWCAAPEGKTVTIEVPAEFTVTNLSECATLVEGSEGKPHTITWTPSADRTQISWYATPTGVSDIKVVETTAKLGDEVVDSLQYAIYHVNGSVADEYQASITEHTERTDGIEFKETEVRRQESTADPGDQANWRSAGDAYRNAAGSEVTTSYMSDCARWEEGGDGYDAAERTKAHLEVQGATVEEPVLIPAYVFTVCTAHNFSRSICEKNINDLLTDYGICVIKGVDCRGVARDSLVAYRSAEGNNDAEWKAYLDGLKFGSDEHYTNVLPIAIKEVLFGSFAARSERASLVHDVCALYTSFDCSPSYSMVGRELVNGYMAPAWGDFNTWIVANDSFWAYLADRYVANETYFSMSELGDSGNGTFDLSVGPSDWDVWYSAPALAVNGRDFVPRRFLQVDEVGRAALMDPMNYVTAHESRPEGTYSALYPYNRSFDECNIEPVKGTLAMEAVVRDGFTVTHICAEHDGFVVEANVKGDPASGYELTPTGNGTLRGANTKTIEAVNEDGEVKLRLVLDGQKATVYALGHESEDPKNIRLNIEANVDHAKVPEGTWFDVYAGNPQLTWTGQQIIDIQPPILGLAGPDLTLKKVQVKGDASANETVTDDNPWTEGTLTLEKDGTLSYSFKLENKGKVAATGVYIEDYLPEGLTLSDTTIKAINAQKAKGKDSFWVQEERHFKYYVADTIAAATEVDGALKPTELDLTKGEPPFIVVTTLPGEENAVYANSAKATARELPDPVESNTVIATTGSHVEWTPFAEKEMETGVLQEGQFSFRLWTEGESVEALAPMPLGATTTTDGKGKAVSEIVVANDAPTDGKGKIDFGTIVFTEAKTYTYYLQEVVPASATANKPVNGVTYDTAVYEVKVAVSAGGDGGYKIDSIDVSKVVAPEAAGSPARKSEAESLATFTNSATGSLEISKQVVGTESQQEKNFTFEIQLYDTSFSGTLSDVEFSSGEATVTLHHGQSKLIEGLPAGMGYEVKETVPAGFNMTSTGSVGSIPVGGTAEASFTNIAKGALTITKTVKGTSDPDDLTTKFSFTITLSGIPGDSVFAAGKHGDLEFAAQSDGTFVATCELANGDSATATGLPEGAHYKVEEADAEGYDAKLANAEGTILATGFVNVQATNTKEAGDLVVYKTVPTLDVSGLEPAIKKFTITVTLDQANFSGEYGDFTFVNGKASVTLASGEQKVARGLPAGIGYTVTEAAADGYTTEYRGETGEIRAGATEQATVTNNITTGSLKVSKTVVPKGAKLTDEELAQEFSFTVTLYKPAADGTRGSVADDISGSYPGTYPGSVGGVEFKSGVATFKLKHGESVTINQLPPGYFYTVTEGNASDYTTASTGSEGQIPANGTATASFVNTHGKVETASLVVSKTVTGTVAPGTKFKFTVTLTKGGLPLTGAYGDYVFNESGQTKLELQGDEEAVITGIPAESHYTVTETRNGSVGDYTITKEGDTGDLKAGDVANASFTNNFITTGGLSITKKIEGFAPTSGTWYFTVTLTGNAATDVTGDYSGVRFDKGIAKDVGVGSNSTVTIEGLPAGLHYKVEETGAEGYTTTYENAEGEVPSGGTAAVTCTNTYAPKITVPLSLTKQVVNASGEAISWDYSANPFEFELQRVNPDDSPLPADTTASTSGSGTSSAVTWSEITFTEAGTYTYKVKETTPSNDSVICNGTEYTVTILVTGGGTQPLSVDSVMWSWDGGSITGANGPTVDNQTVGALKISKKLEGENVNVDENREWNFTITLTKDGDSPLSGTFDDVEFGTNGEATVQLKGGESREIKGIPAGARYTVVEQEADVAPYSTTSVGAEGTIQTGETAEAAFTNTKAEAKTTPALVDIKKTVISAGNAKSIKGHVFSFRVTPDAQNPEGDPLADGSKTVITPGVASGNTETVELFDHEFSQVGKYRYTVSEETGADPAISYDRRTFTVEVEITPGSYDAEHNLYPLLAKATIKDAMGAVLAEGGDGTSKAKLEVEFENTYNVKEITVPLRAHKTLEGEGMELKPGDFTFELTAAEGTPLPEGVTAPIKKSNDTTGYVQFGSVTFHEAGTFTYTIHEVIPADGERVSGMTYDESTWQATVEVKDNDSAGLSAEVTYAKVVEPPAADHPEVNSNAAEFVNSYEPPTPPPPPSEGAPALVVSKTHGLNDDAFEHSHTLVNEVAEGNVVTYFVKVENTGTARATGVTVRDVVPEGLELVPGSVSEGGSVGADGRTITWDVGALDAGASAVVSFSVTVPAVDAETTWTNVASAWAEEVPDPKATNVVMEHATPPENPPDEPDNPDNPPDTPGNPGTPDTPSTPDTPGNPGTPGAPSEPKSPEMAIPKTGDDTPLTLALLLGVAGVSLLAATLALLLRRRRA